MASVPPGTMTATGGGGFKGATDADRDDAMKAALRESCMIKAAEPKPVRLPCMAADMERLAATVPVILPDSSDDEEGLVYASTAPKTPAAKETDLEALLPAAPSGNPAAPKAPKRKVRFGGGGGGGQPPGETPQPPPQLAYKPPPPRHCCVQCIETLGGCLAMLIVLCCGWLPCCKESSGYDTGCCQCGACDQERLIDALNIEDKCMRLFIVSVLGMIAGCLMVSAAVLQPILIPGFLAYALPVFYGTRFRVFVPVHATVSTLVDSDADEATWNCKLAVVYIVFFVWLILGGVLPAAMAKVALIPGVLYGVTHLLFVAVGVLQLVGELHDNQ